MKYIKALNIDFNNWEEIKDDLDGFLIPKYAENFILFKDFLIEKGLFDKYINNLKENNKDWKIFFLKTIPETWISSSFNWGIDYGKINWNIIDEEWEKTLRFYKKNK